MNLGKYAEYKEGKIIIDVGAMAEPVLIGIKEKIESGAIDPVKNTDLDKVAMMKMIDAIIAAVK